MLLSLIVSLVERCISSTPSGSGWRGAAEDANPREPADHATRALVSVLALAVAVRADHGRRIDVESRDGARRAELAPAADVARRYRRARPHERAGIRPHGRRAHPRGRCPHSRASVAEDRVHVFQPDAARLRVDEIYYA